MNTRFKIHGVVLVLLAAGSLGWAQPVITSFSNSGALVCSNLTPGGTAWVAWAQCLSGPWQINLAGVEAIPVGVRGTIEVSVPVTNAGAAFYRVLGISNSVPVGMALVPAGWFTMGDTLDGEPDAVPTNIFVSSFYVDTNLVTYNLWRAVCSYATNQGYGFDSAASGKGTNYPVDMVSWYDSVKWCNARSQQSGLAPVYYTDPGLTKLYTNGVTDQVYPNWSANGYRLPTEAEWEKAARGALTGQRFPWGMTISEFHANYYALPRTFSYDLGPNTGYNMNFDTGGYPYTSPVGYFGPNGYGLNDMAGNVFGWCWDWYGTPYGQPTTNNPTGPTSGDYRVLRGGDWSGAANVARSAQRYDNDPGDSSSGFGIRCVRGH